MQQVDYRAWHPGEPNDDQGKEDCAGLWTSKQGDWNDFNCDQSNAYICKTKPGA